MIYPALPGLAALRTWLIENRPDIYERIADLTIESALYHLNQEAGTDLKPSDPVDAGSMVILQALKDKAGSEA